MSSLGTISLALIFPRDSLHFQVVCLFEISLNLILLPTIKTYSLLSIVYPKWNIGPLMALVIYYGEGWIQNRKSLS